MTIKRRKDGSYTVRVSDVMYKLDGAASVSALSDPSLRLSRLWIHVYA